ncbi:MAG: hypothetical protein ACI8TS_002102, partial [Flavobacteriales bacterium]
PIPKSFSSKLLYRNYSPTKHSVTPTKFFLF